MIYTKEIKELLEEEHKKLFEGDGRVVLNPPEACIGLSHMLGATPKNVRRSAAKMAIEQFERFGMSNHSSAGHMLWIIIMHCYLKGLCYQIRVMPNGGFLVQKFDEPGFSQIL